MITKADFTLKLEQNNSPSAYLYVSGADTGAGILLEEADLETLRHEVNAVLANIRNRPA